MKFKGGKECPTCRSMNTMKSYAEHEAAVRPSVTRGSSVCPSGLASASAAAARGTSHHRIIMSCAEIDEGIFACLAGILGSRE